MPVKMTILGLVHPNGCPEIYINLIYSILKNGC